MTISQKIYLSSIIEQNKALAIEYSLPHLFILEESSKLFLLFWGIIRVRIVESSQAQEPEDMGSNPNLDKIRAYLLISMS